MFALQVLALFPLLAVLSLGPGLPFVQRLRWSVAERLGAALPAHVVGQALATCGVEATFGANTTASMSRELSWDENLRKLGGRRFRVLLVPVTAPSASPRTARPTASAWRTSVCGR